MAILTLPAQARLKDRLKLLLGALLFPRQTRRWQGFVSAEPALRALIPRFPYLLHKIYRPYLSRHLDCQARVDTVIAHYQALRQQHRLSLMWRSAEQPLPLAQLTGRAGARFQLSLAAATGAHREGELALLLHMDGQPLYTAAFALGQGAQGPVLTVGALQGQKGADAAERIRAATRALDGWRPKNLMLTALRQLGQILGCGELVLVSNHNRVAVNPRRRARISADYDSLWREAGAVERPDRNFSLAAALQAEPDWARIPSHKRSAVRKRLAHQHSLQHALRSQLVDERLAA